MAERVEPKAVLRRGGAVYEIFDEKIALRVAEQLLAEEGLSRPGAAKASSASDIRPEREKAIWGWDAQHLRGYLSVLKPNALKLVSALASSPLLRASTDLATELGFEHARAVGPIVAHIRGKAIGMGLEDPIELARDSRNQQCLTVTSAFRECWLSCQDAEGNSRSEARSTRPPPPPQRLAFDDLVPPSAAIREKFKLMAMAVGRDPTASDREDSDD